MRKSIWCLVLLWTWSIPLCAAALDFPDKRDAISYQRAIELAAETRYDTAQVILAELAGKYHPHQPALHLEVVLDLAELFIRKLDQRTAWKLISYSTAYYRKHPGLPGRAHFRSRILEYLADLAYQFEDFELARKNLQEALANKDLKPQDLGRLQLKLGMTHRLLREDSLVVLCYQRALEVLPESACRDRMRTHQEMGTYFYKAKVPELCEQHFGEARSLLNRCDQDRPDDQITQLYYEAKVLQWLHGDDGGAEIKFIEATTLTRIYECYSPLLPYCYSALGKVQFEHGFFEDARDTYLAYLDFYQHIKYDPEQIGKAYGYLANCFSRMGDYEASLWYYAEQIKLYKQEAMDGRNLGDALHNYGQGLINNGEVAKGLVQLDSAMSIYLALDKPDGWRISQCYFNIGLGHDLLGNEERALQSYSAARKTNLSMKDIRHADLAHLEVLMAQIYESWGDSLTSNLLFESYVNHFELAKGQGSIATSEPLLETADFCLRKGKVEDALAKFQLALTILVPGYSSQDPMTMPDIQNAISPVQTLDALGGRARALRALYHQNMDVTYLHASLESFRLAVRMLRELRHDHQAEESKFRVSKTKRPMLEAAIQTALEDYEARNDRASLELAFDFSEQGKAMVLLEGLSGTRAEELAGIPVNLRRRKQRLVAEIQKTRLLRMATDDQEASARMGSELFDLQNAYNALLDTFKTQYPRYFEMVYGSNTASLASVQQRLSKENAVMVEYFMGNSGLYSFAISPDSFEVHFAPLTQAFRDTLDSFQVRLTRPAPTNAPAANYARNAQMLYDTLLGNLHMRLPEKLIIVPDGELHYLSFDALVAQPPTDPRPEFHHLNYLVEDHYVSYDYSATVLLRNPSPPGMKKARVLAMAPTFRGHKGLVELRSTKNTLQALSGTYKDMVAYVDQEATKARFKAEASQYDILDLATHGQVDTLEPMNSRLYFSTDGTGDSILYLNELYALKLNARLAILEACETGAGKHQAGEGVMSLARGFTYAGCNSVVMSLWKVSEADGTRRIIELLYEGLEQGKPLDVAVSQGKRAFLEMYRSTEGEGGDIRYCHPFYWAELVVIGDTTPIPVEKADPRFPWYLVALGTLLSIGLVGAGRWWFQRRKAA